MPVDFTRLAGAGDQRPVRPREIFFELDRDPQFAFPRDIQTEVLNRWFERRDEPDLIVKLNVGSGKTVVGLLALQSSINEGKGPALYVAPDRQLVEQVCREANSLGIHTTNDPHDPDYMSGDAICVITIHKLFNGRSVFGVNDAPNPIAIGTVVIDDAHAGISTLMQQFCLRLDAEEDGYIGITDLFRDDLRKLNYARLLDIESAEPGARLEVPFWAWHSRHEDVLDVLHQSRASDALGFSLPLAQDLLPESRCVIGGRHLEIEPLFPAVDQIPSFRRATRRIYMIATLADDTPIVTHFGADPDYLDKPIIPQSTQYMGERMILMPQELVPRATLEEIQKMLRTLSREYNCVVIVPSEFAAEQWSDVADAVWMGEQVAPGIERLRNGHVGLVVLVNRYDGIDLPDASCRILVLSELPEVLSLTASVDSATLGQSRHALKRQLERVEQGIGRAVRSVDDHCVVVLLGPKLIRRIRDPLAPSLLTAATFAQLQLSRQMAEQMKNADLPEVELTIRQCLERNAEWIRASKSALSQLQSSDELTIDRPTVALKYAMDSARANQVTDAVRALTTVIDAETDPALRAWLLARRAAFEHRIHPGQAQSTLLDAYRLARGGLRPLTGVSYSALTPDTQSQSEAVIAFHCERFMTPIDTVLFAQSLCNDLVFMPKTSETFEAAVDALACFIGIKGHRPENQFGEGPDNFWALPTAHYLIIECKNGSRTQDGICKSDVAQLGHSMSWFREHYPALPGTPVMIHPKSTMGATATPVESMRVIDRDAMKRLHRAIDDFATAVSESTSVHDRAAVAAALDATGLHAAMFVDHFTVAPRK